MQNCALQLFLPLCHCVWAGDEHLENWPQNVFRLPNSSMQMHVWLSRLLFCCSGCASVFWCEHTLAISLKVKNNSLSGRMSDFYLGSFPEKLDYICVCFLFFKSQCQHILHMMLNLKVIVTLLGYLGGLIDQWLHPVTGKSYREMSALSTSGKSPC